MPEKTRRLFTKEESDIVGWDEDLYEGYPSKELFDKVLEMNNRLEMIRFHRFLMEPQTREEIEMVERLIERLAETCPGAS